MTTYDLGLGDVIGEHKVVDTPPKEPPKKKFNLNYAWICIPRLENGQVKVIIREITECSPELFKEWVELVLPSQKKKDYSLKKFNTAAKRYKAHAEIIN